MKACKSYKRIAMFVDKGFVTNDWPSLSIQWTRLTINCKVGEIS